MWLSLQTQSLAFIILRTGVKKYLQQNVLQCSFIIQSVSHVFVIVKVTLCGKQILRSENNDINNK